MSEQTQPETTPQPVKDSFGWGKLEVYDPVIQPADKCSATSISKSLSIIFTGLQISLQEQTLALSAVSIATASVPVSLPDRENLAGYLVDLRGFIDKGEGARVVIFADLGGACRILEFPYGEAANKPLQPAIFSIERRVSKDRDPERPPLSPFTITLVISAQRRTPQDTVNVSVDTLDVVAVSA